MGQCARSWHQGYPPVALLEILPLTLLKTASQLPQAGGGSQLPHHQLMSSESFPNDELLLCSRWFGHISQYFVLWMNFTFCYSSLKFDEIPSVPNLLCFGITSQLCAINTHQQHAPDICANGALVSRLCFQQTTCYFIHPDKGWLNPASSLSTALDAKHPPGKTVVTPPEIKRGLPLLLGCQATALNKWKSSRSVSGKLLRNRFEYASFLYFLRVNFVVLYWLIQWEEKRKKKPTPCV